MQTGFNRESRLRILAELCSNNNLNPNRGNYAAFIQSIAVTHLNTSVNTAKELVTALTISYRRDQWQSLLTDEQDDVAGDSRFEPNRIGIAPKPEVEAATANVIFEPVVQHESIQAELTKIAETIQPEPVKHLATRQSTQQDNLTEKQIAQILYTTAQRDIFDGVGRIILSDARYITDNKHLQIDELLNFWQRNYPIINAETRSNILLIYWDGKDTVRNKRNLNTVIQPKAPVYRAKNNPAGDIEEDDDGVIPEAEVNQIG
jgi:hypothetical protein